MRTASKGEDYWQNVRKFTGYEKDGTGLYHARARAYSQGRGRFQQPDPLGLGAADLSAPQTLNAYAYVHNDPINFTDPEGLDDIPTMGMVDMGKTWASGLGPGADRASRRVRR